MMDINVGLLQWSMNFLIEKTSRGAATYANKSAVKNEIISNKELAEELYKSVINKFKKTKVQSPFIENIWGADLADKQLISKFKKGFRVLLCVNDGYSKYGWVIPLKDSFTITSASHKIFFELNWKPNKI